MKKQGLYSDLLCEAVDANHQPIGWGGHC